MKTPTPGALRAAFQLECEGRLREVIGGTIPGDRITAAASVVDRETALPALIDALQDLLVCSVPTGQDTRTDRAMLKAREALSKAQG